MVKELKRRSSLWIKTKNSQMQDLAWESGYGIFSIGFSQLESVRAYIANQESITSAFRSKTNTGNFYAVTKSRLMKGMFGTERGNDETPSGLPAGWTIHPG